MIKPFIKPSLIVSCLFLFPPYSNAVTPVQEVHDTSANATAALTASRMADSLNKATTMIKQYTQMIEKAKEQLNELNRINDMMNSVNSFLNTSTLNIADPGDLIKQAKAIRQRIENNSKRLLDTVKNYKIRDHIASRRLNKACPWLSYSAIAPKQTEIPYSKTGKESEEIKAIKNLGNALSDNIVSNSQSVAGTLSGRAMGLEFCAQASSIEHEIKQHEYAMKLKQYLLQKDFDSYAQTKKEWEQIEQEYKKDMRFLQAQQTDPLLNRAKQMMETLGVSDKTYNKGDKVYCEESKNDKGEFCYPQFYNTQRLNDEFNELQDELVRKLQMAGSDKKAQANVYADIKQKQGMLLLSYIKDIADNLSFMNETVSLMSNLVARDYKYKYGDDDYNVFKDQIDKKTEEINQDFISNTGEDFKDLKNYSAKLDKFGFPILTFVSKKSDTD
ncbi:hypothetical protein [Helicobacter sp. 11S03491-1]|uniref:hypothetical protein n=1 Tax=Helicobacter sp. 11S03491-1 TaxID=1476196 RepID=UPI000BA4FC19|nr:hypothetical protein [Helicobacter sp. 11S03491-1]PAF41049.1 hypothetical protein BKH45_08555 [Helicobacter sp. 11S03491-1]